MKKILWLSAAVLTSAALFVGCQKTIESSADDISGGRTVERKANAQPVVTFSTSPAVAGQPVTVNVEFGTCGSAQLQAYNTQTMDWYQLVGNTNATAGNPDITFTFTPDSVGTCAYKFRVIASGGQNCTLFTGPQAETCLDVIKSSCAIDANEFTGTAVVCAQTGRTAEYIFGSEDGVGYFKMQGGLNNFTGTNATVYINDVMVNFTTVSGDGWDTGTVGGYTVGQRTPGGSTNRNIRVEGGLGECTAVKVKIVWNTVNGGTTITGDWSVKDAGGIELAPTVAGLTCN